MKGALLIWFDKLTMSGYEGSESRDPEGSAPLTLSLSKGGPLIWFDKLTMSDYAKAATPGFAKISCDGGGLG